MRIASLSSVLPRRCGIAHFNASLVSELRFSGIEVHEVAVGGNGKASRPGVIRQQVRFDYREEALRLGDVDVVLVQHEYGLFGGAAGSYLLEFVDRVRRPVVTVFHTVLPRPESAVRNVTMSLLATSRRNIVMCETAADLLVSVYRCDPSSVVVIPHGYPQLARQPVPPPIGALGPGAFALVSLGLLGPNKGIELAIEALPAILYKCPSANFFVVGSTHPAERGGRGDPYRAYLERTTEELGVSGSVTFLNRYVDLTDHVAWIDHADVVILPYRDLRQVSSGTLAYSIGRRRPVVASPFVYASDVARAGAGVVLAALDAHSIANAVTCVLSDAAVRSDLAQRSNSFARRSTWRAVSREYIRTLAAV